MKAWQIPASGERNPLLKIESCEVASRGYSVSETTQAFAPAELHSTIPFKDLEATLLDDWRT